MLYLVRFKVEFVGAGLGVAQSTLTGCGTLARRKVASGCGVQKVRPTKQLPGMLGRHDGNDWQLWYSRTRPFRLHSYMASTCGIDECRALSNLLPSCERVTRSISFPFVYVSEGGVGKAEREIAVGGDWRRSANPRKRQEQDVS